MLLILLFILPLHFLLLELPAGHFSLLFLPPLFFLLLPFLPLPFFLLPLFHPPPPFLPLPVFPESQFLPLLQFVGLHFLPLRLSAASTTIITFSDFLPGIMRMRPKPFTCSAGGASPSLCSGSASRVPSSSILPYRSRAHNCSNDITMSIFVLGRGIHTSPTSLLTP